MTDVVSKRVRSRMMAGIRGKDTKPEMVVRRGLFNAGYRYRLHRRDLPGSPDLVLSGARVAIFVHGCFWHQHVSCPDAARPKSNMAFWVKKLEGNIGRDRMAIDSLTQKGWRVLTVWECATRYMSADALIRLTVRWIKGTETLGEIPSRGLTLQKRRKPGNLATKSKRGTSSRGNDAGD